MVSNKNHEVNEPQYRVIETPKNFELTKLESNERMWNVKQKFEERKWVFQTKITIYLLFLFTLNIILFFMFTINQPNVYGTVVHALFTGMLPFFRIFIRNPPK